MEHLNDISKNVLRNGAANSSGTIYYGVHVPSDVQDAENYSNIFEDKVEALKIVKKCKKARFKAFNFYPEAVEFALHGSEYPNNNTTPNKRDSNASAKEHMQSVCEKPSPFRGPKSQDLVKLRKSIEAGSLYVVQTTIWENPRYLISSGDTPSILQEGCRYNALHVAARSKNREMCELILNTVSNTNFIKLLYGDDNHQDADKRAAILLDLYLNTPDKGLNETPLHFAVKLGALEVVELLVSFSQCDKKVVNKFGKSPSMIICDRCENASTVLKSKIAVLLEETYYVPVLRSEDNCLPPAIGEPFVPTDSPNINTDILSPRMEIHAYAGPMNKECAENFRKLWKTPPRPVKFKSSSTRLDLIDDAELKYKDIDKGLERLGRNLAEKFDIDWKEYWPFLGNFINLSTPAGLNELEKYLTKQFNAENGSSNSSENYAKSLPKDNEISPISDLCRDMDACNLSDGSIKKTKTETIVHTSFNDNAEDVISEVQLFKSDLSPFLCIEKSCQVFAHRISNDILHLLETDYCNTTISLEVQMKQLELLMASFMDDSRFVTVDFHLVHYRLGYLISNKLQDVLLLEDEYNFMKNTLEQWLESCNKQFDYFSSDDESCNYRQPLKRCKRGTSKNQKVICLLEHILVALISETQPIYMSNINDEEDCIRIWSDAKPCICVWRTNTSRRSSLIKKGNSFKFTSKGLSGPFQSESEGTGINRQLTFEDEEQVSNVSENDCDMFTHKLDKDADQSLLGNSLEIIEEEFYTPPNSPSVSVDSSEDEDMFEDCRLPEQDVFIEGSVPTKTDYAVYNAVKCADNQLNYREYPNIYKWCHIVSLYSESERKSWPSPKYAAHSFPITSTPTRTDETVNRPNGNSSIQYTPCNSWLRITGANSPRNRLRSIARKNFSFNL